MIEAARVIELIQSTASSLDKQYLLQKNADVPGLKTILKHIYNPYLKTGMSKAKLAQVNLIARLSTYEMGETPFISYTDMINYFSKHQTGTDSDIFEAARFINCTRVMYAANPFTVTLAEAIISQKLQIGVSTKTLNAVYGNNFIPVIGCMLGVNSSGMSHKEIEWPCIVTEKLDGIRRILIKENGECKFVSRSGHEDVGLVDIMREAAFLPDNRVYDGELLAIGTFSNSIALRQASMSRSAGNVVKQGLTYNVFDMMHLDDFYAGISKDVAGVRKLLLGATLMDDSIQLLNDVEATWPSLIQLYGVHQPMQFIKYVPILGYVRSMQEVEPIVESIWSRGGEGVMLNVADGSYEIKRSKSLIKVKHSTEIVLKIVSFTEGTGKYENTLGAVVVEYKGNYVKVGSGFSDSLRAKIWQDPEFYAGRLIEIETFGESANQRGALSINCPIFKRFVDEE